MTIIENDTETSSSLNKEAGRPLGLIVDVLADLGCPLEALLIDSGIRGVAASVEALSLPQKCHLYRTAVARLEAIVCRTDGITPHGFEGFKMLIYCVIHAPDLRTVLQRIIYFYSMLQGNRGQHFLLEQDEMAFYEMNTERRMQHPGAFLIDQIGLASLHCLSSWLIGGALPVTAVKLACPREYGDFSERLFKKPITYNAAVYGISFSRAWLDAPVIRTYGELEDSLPLFPYDLMLTQVFSETFSDRLRLLITSRLRKDQSVPAAEEIARLYNMSISTLRRRCREGGESYKEIRERCLLELACEWLRSSQLDVEDVALKLGFGDGRSFRRAFKRWTGVSPSEYR